MRRIYIETTDSRFIRNEIFLRDYTASLDKSMRKDANGFWHSWGREITLDTHTRYSRFFKKTWVDTEEENESAPPAGTLVIREKASDEGLEYIVATPMPDRPLPAIVVCLGGPIIPPPDLKHPNPLFRFLLSNHFALIIPLRRGVSGISEQWESALEGHYGTYDVQDTVEAAKAGMKRHPDLIDPDRLFLYGGSYGGYVAALIAGRANHDKLFKAIVSHCGIYDLATYPWHNQGNPDETMNTYGGTTDKRCYTERIAEISPKSHVDKWGVPMLLVHHLNDMSSWFGQSVMAYNDALKRGKEVKLLIVPGPHSYDIEQRDKLFQEITTFFGTL